MAVSEEMMERRKQVGAKIHLARWERKWSLRDLAARSGIPDTTLSRYERGKSTPGADELVAIAQALATTPNDLLDFRQTGLYLNALAATAA